MGVNSRLMIPEAERRFAVRVRVAVPSAGFGERLNRMHAWLDDNCGADGWEITPAGMCGVINDAIAVYFRDATMLWWANAALAVFVIGAMWMALNGGQPAILGPPQRKLRAVSVIGSI